MVVVKVEGMSKCRFCGHTLYAWDACSEHTCHEDCCKSFMHRTREDEEPRGSE